MENIYLIIVLSLIFLSILSLIFLFFTGIFIYKLYLKGKLKSDSTGKLSLLSKDPKMPKIGFDIRSNALIMLAVLIMLTNIILSYFLMKEVLQEYRLSKASSIKTELPKISGYVVSKKTNAPIQNVLIKITHEITDSGKIDTLNKGLHSGLDGSFFYKIPNSIILGANDYIKFDFFLKNKVVQVYRFNAYSNNQTIELNENE
jgi:hypothetical protein